MLNCIATINLAMNRVKYTFFFICVILSLDYIIRSETTWLKQAPWSDFDTCNTESSREDVPIYPINSECMWEASFSIQLPSCIAFSSWQCNLNGARVHLGGGSQNLGLFNGPSWIINVKLSCSPGLCGQQEVCWGVCSMLMPQSKCLQLDKGITSVWCGSSRKCRDPVAFLKPRSRK